MLERINEDALENVTGAISERDEFDRAWRSLKGDKCGFDRVELFHQWVDSGKRTSALEFLSCYK